MNLLAPCLPIVDGACFGKIRALVNTELEACLVLHESKEFWQQRLDRAGANLLNWIEMGGSVTLLIHSAIRLIYCMALLNAYVSLNVNILFMGGASCGWLMVDPPDRVGFERLRHETVS